jgi:hypothetical protein
MSSGLRKNRFRSEPEAAFSSDQAGASFWNGRQAPVGNIPAGLLVALFADLALGLGFNAAGMGAVLAGGLCLVATGFRHYRGGEDREREGRG